VVGRDKNAESDALMQESEELREELLNMVGRLEAFVGALRDEVDRGKVPNA
jgi:hypothetical protein